MGDREGALDGLSVDAAAVDQGAEGLPGDERPVALFAVEEARVHFLTGNAARGQPTILLDEPERSYDLNAQVRVWRFLRAFSDEVQFIVASHSLFALKIPEAHYVELSPRYLRGCEAVLEILQKWPDERPTKLSENDEVTVRRDAGPKKTGLTRPRG